MTTSRNCPRTMARLDRELKTAGRITGPRRGCPSADRASARACAGDLFGPAAEGAPPRARSERGEDNEDYAPAM